MKNLRSKIIQATHYTRDPQVRARAQLLLRALDLANVAEACREAGISPQLYHYWWRRFRESGFRREGLSARSRRPKRSPRQISAQVARWIREYREKFSYSGEKIRLLLEQEKKIRISLPTVYRVLARGRSPAKRISTPRKPAAADPRVPALDQPRSKSVAALPQRIGDRYRVKGLLGSGGGGVVYLVRDEQGGKEQVGETRALKFVETPRGADPGLASMLKNEFAALAGLAHQNLAQVYDLGITPTGIYFTSEYIPGRDLLSAAREADLNTIFQMIVQILAALDYLHHKGILHLDLKPANILVTDSPRGGGLQVKLIDFGGASLRRRGQAEAGETMGTPPYVAPELLLEGVPGPAADLYSLGMLLHQIFYGAFPFQHSDPIRMVQEQIYEPPLRLSNLNPALPEAFGELLHRMVARDPAERFGSARQALAAFNECLGEDYSLRPPALPAGILQESSYLFQKDLFEELVAAYQQASTRLIVLSGPAGSGKTHLLTRIKAALQLLRVFPVILKDPAQLESGISAARRARVPLFLDPDPEPGELSALLETLDEAGLPVLLCSRQPFSPERLANRWIELKPLEPGQVGAFFQSEFEYSDADPRGPLPQLGAGTPQHLETLLQALQEEGALQWSDQGWRWVAEAEPEFSGLLKRHAARWLEQRDRVAELLSSSPLGMNVTTLAGILGLESAWLEPHLETWTGQGLLKRRPVKNQIHYALKKAVPGKAGPAVQGWEKIAAELARLYAEGSFEAGVRWADQLLAEAEDGAGLPAEVALVCARHYVALGAGDRALAALPPTPPAKLRGLALEIRARAESSRGELEAVEKALQAAEAEFLAQKDAAGCSRVANLRGSLAKKRLDFPAAERNFQTAIEMARNADQAYLLGLAQMNLGLFYQEQGDYRRAYQLYEAASETAARAAHPWLSGRLLQNWLNLLFSMGRAAEAEKKCYELLRLALRHRYVELQAVAVNFLALLAGQQGRREAQAAHLNQALHLLRSRELWLPYTQTLLNRAFFFWEQGRATPAELDAGYALDLAKRSRHPHFIAWAQLLLGRILRDRPRPDLAESAAYLNRAHQRLHQLNNRILLWEVEFDRGLLAKKLGRVEEARDFFLAAERHLQDLMAELPESVRASYLRDRKLEKVRAEIGPSKIGSS